MNCNKIFLSLVLLTIYHVNYSTDVPSNGNANQVEYGLKTAVDDTREGRLGWGGSGGGGSNLGNIDSVFGQFWHTLYINRGFNSSFVFIVPLFTITIPGYGRGLQNQSPLSALNLGNLAVVGIITFGSLALWSPLLFPDFSGQGTTFRGFESLTPSLAKALIEAIEQNLGRALDVDDKHPKVNNFLISRLNSIVDSTMSFVDKLIDHWPQYSGLKPKECIKRAICESYRRPDGYGRVGRILRFLFRPYQKTTKQSAKDSKYRLSANYGLKDKSIECNERYAECHLNFAHLFHNAIEFLF